MDLKELNNMDVSELAQREKFLKKELFDMRQQSRLGKAEKPARFNALRKEIARIMTIINERKNQNGKKS
jgi:large subunit ribosomal protein L29